jgi:hypothetical protein
VEAWAAAASAVEEVGAEAAVAASAPAAAVTLAAAALRETGDAGQIHTPSQAPLAR